ncbi:hypothetical protein D9M68_817620 [compost metagenome]
MTHGCKTELGIGSPLKGDEVGVLANALHIFATTRPWQQYRWVLVRGQRQGIQFIACPGTESFQRRQPLRIHLGLEIDLEKTGKTGIASEQVHAPAIGDIQFVV